MPRRKKAEIVEEPPVEAEERHEVANSALRASTIREACEEIAEFDRQIDSLKAEKKAVIETRIVADLGMKKGDFATAYKLHQAGQDERDTLFDTIREVFQAQGIGFQLDWVAAAEVKPNGVAPHSEAREQGKRDGQSGDYANPYTSGQYGYADYELGFHETAGIPAE